MSDEAKTEPAGVYRSGMRAALLWVLVGVAIGAVLQRNLSDRPAARNGYAALSDEQLMSVFDAYRRVHECETNQKTGPRQVNLDFTTPEGVFQVRCTDDGRVDCELTGSPRTN